VTDGELGLHVALLTTGTGAVSDSDACLRTLPSYWAASPSPSRRCDYFNCTLTCQGWLISMGGLPSSEEKGRRRGWGRVDSTGEGQGVEEEGGETGVGM